MDKKYELTNESIKVNGRVLYRIRSLKDFADVKAGDLGGYVQREANLSQYGDCWIYDDAAAYDFSCVMGGSRIKDQSRINCYAKITDNALLLGKSTIIDEAFISGYAQIGENARITGKARVNGYASVRGTALVGESALVTDNARIIDHSEILNNAIIRGDVIITGYAEIGQNAIIENSFDYTTIEGFGSSQRVTTFFRRSDGEIGVVCGCFQGNSLDEFRNQVKETRSGKIAEEYLMIADLMEKHFNEENE